MLGLTACGCAIGFVLQKQSLISDSVEVVLDARKRRNFSRSLPLREIRKVSLRFVERGRRFGFLIHLFKALCEQIVGLPVLRLSAREFVQLIGGRRVLAGPPQR